MKKLIKIKPLIFPAIGVLCILRADHIAWLLPYLIGGAMMAVGALISVNCFQEGRFSDQNSEESVYGIVMFIMGLAFIIKNENALGPIGTTWAVLGIRKAAKSLKQALRQIHMKKQSAILFFEFVIRMMFALLLLFDPYEKFSTHIVILGAQLIVSNMRFGKIFPSGWDEES